MTKEEVELCALIPLASLHLPKLRRLPCLKCQPLFSISNHWTDFERTKVQPNPFLSQIVYTSGLAWRKSASKRAFFCSWAFFFFCCLGKFKSDVKVTCCLAIFDLIRHKQSYTALFSHLNLKMSILLASCCRSPKSELKKREREICP